MDIVAEGAAAVRGTRLAKASEGLRVPLLRLTAALVDDPSAMRLTVTHERNKLIFGISVGPGDLGKVIGRSGRNADALRTLLSAMARRYRVSVMLEIHEHSSVGGRG